MLRVAELQFRYAGADKDVLDGVNIEAAPGQHLLIMGPTGAGKTTLCCALRGLLGTFLDGRTEGVVEVAGRRVLPAPPGGHPVALLTPVVGLVLQDFERQLFSTTVVKEVAFGPENLNLPRREIARRVEWALDLVGLRGFEARNPATLSGGEKQRLAIASVLALRPRLLILDEPTTDLDPAGKAGVFALRERIASEVDLLVMVEHEIEPAVDFERLAIFAGGRVVASGDRRLLLQPSLFDRHAVQSYEPAVIAAEIGVDSLDPVVVGRSLADRFELSRAEPMTKAPGPSALSLTNVDFGYGRALVLEDLTVEIGEGQFVAILGHNGCGKTTAAKLMAGLLRASRGNVRLFGEEVGRHDFAWIATRVGYVFQNPDHQIFSSSIAEEVSFGPSNLGLDEREVRLRVNEVLETVGLSSLSGADPFTLPKGVRQMVAVASVLAMQPRILILDEPTTGLDREGQRAVLALLGRLNEMGHTIVIITHSMRAALEHASRTLVMKNGRILADGRSEDVFYGPHIEEAGLLPPPIVRLARAAGVRARSADHLLALAGRTRKQAEPRR